MKITFDFDKNEMTYECGTQYVPDLDKKRDAILEAAGLKIIPNEEMRHDIDSLVEELGLNIRCASPEDNE